MQLSWNTLLEYGIGPSQRKWPTRTEMCFCTIRTIHLFLEGHMIQIHSQTNRNSAVFDIRSLTVPATTFLDAGGGASTRIEN